MFPRLTNRASVSGTDTEWNAFLAAGDPDWEYGFKDSPELCRERRAYFSAIKKLNQEFENVRRKTPKPSSKGRKCQLFCGPRSRLTQQVINLGHHACRFALPYTDLMTVEGRQVLFEKLIVLQPEDVWYSPECGPWSAWSNLNQSKSCQAWDTIQAQRLGNIDQLALGTILLRHQRQQGKHFHWEQPQRSNMFRTPLLQEVYCQTIAAEFDMCEVGELRDPENQMLIKKGMTIMTTSEALHKQLHGRFCNRGHQHQPLEGSTKVQGNNISRTKFSEAYPRKFARCVAQVLCRQGRIIENPINTLQEVHANDVEDPLAKRPRLSMRTKAVRPSSSSEVQNRDPENPEKRRRIMGKGGTISSQIAKIQDEKCSNPEAWKAILDDIAPQLPRVGRKDIEHPEIKTRVQQLIHPKVLHSIVAGRGLNRTTAPLSKTQQGEAPYRMLVYIHRDKGTLEGGKQWEAWDQLPKRQVVRTGFPSKIAMTVFAANPSTASPAAEIEADIPRPLQSTTESKIPTPLDEVCQDDLKEQETVRHPEPGPLFQQLSKEDQQLLMKIHKNSGHPGADKLAYLLKQQGFRPEMIAAVPDLRCAACDATRGPKISRPSAIHSPCDFNDSISMDGYTWTSKGGKQFHFYHIIDYSTNFHVAKYAPNRSVESAISCVQQAWFSWAGSPNELIIDAGSELNAEAFSVFSQQNNIKCTTISTEAHWQNGRAERHGAILGNMLTKCEVEHPIVTSSDFDQMLTHCTQAKNALSIRKGYRY